MLCMAIGQLIHEEQQREIERNLEVRRLLEPADEPARSQRYETRKTDAERALSARQEAAGAAS